VLRRESAAVLADAAAQYSFEHQLRAGQSFNLRRFVTRATTSRPVCRAHDPALPAQWTWRTGDPHDQLAHRFGHHRAIPVQSAGVNLAKQRQLSRYSLLKAYFTEGWDTEKFSLTITSVGSVMVVRRENIHARQLSGFDSRSPDINDNVMEGALTSIRKLTTYGAGYRYFKIDNVLNNPRCRRTDQCLLGVTRILRCHGRMYRVGCG